MNEQHDPLMMSEGVIAVDDRKKDDKNGHIRFKESSDLSKLELKTCHPWPLKHMCYPRT